MRFDAINPGPALTDDALSAYCAEHGLALPKSLRAQLLDQNGGAPEDDFLVTVDGHQEELMSFFGANMGDPATELAWNAATFRDRIPDGLLPFANDPGGNLYLIAVGDHEDGAVWFWDHEREGEPDAATLAAPSLDAFLAGLHRADDAG